MIRRGGVTDVPRFLARLEIKCQHFTALYLCLVISQLRVLASHTGNLGSVAQGAWELEDLPLGRCHFLSDPCVLGLPSKKKCL